MGKNWGIQDTHYHDDLKQILNKFCPDSSLSQACLHTITDSVPKGHPNLACCIFHVKSSAVGHQTVVTLARIFILLSVCPASK